MSISNSINPNSFGDTDTLAANIPPHDEGIPEKQAFNFLDKNTDIYIFTHVLNSFKLLKFSAIFGFLILFSQPVRAASLKALSTGAVTNIFKECLNDGTALVYNEDAIDSEGWYYSFDSIFDGVAGQQIGGNGYEIHGSAIKETKDSLWVVLNSNMPLAGLDGTAAEDGNIGWGDWFLNLSGKDFTTASNEGSLFAVRFARTNDSLVPNVGLYGNVKAVSTTSVNSGFASLNEYHQNIYTYGCPDGSCTNLGDLPANTTYFDQNQSLNAIGSGNYLAGITYLSLQELQEVGYNTSNFAGSETIAFKFDKSGICDSGSCQSVPEPSSLLGIIVAGLGMRVMRRHRAAT